jgi:signal peptidase
LLGSVFASGLALLAAISVPVLFGCRSLVVMSGSMEPAISTGSVVVVERIPGADIAAGDVVSFHAPGSTMVLTHRVQSVAVREGMVEVVTRGDANTGTESWAIEPTGTVGRLVFEVPYLGYLLAPLQNPIARILLVVLPALALGGLLLVSIWRDPAASGRPAPGRRRRERIALRPAGSEGS